MSYPKVEAWPGKVFGSSCPGAMWEKKKIKNTLNKYPMTHNTSHDNVPILVHGPTSGPYVGSELARCSAGGGH